LICRPRYRPEPPSFLRRLCWFLSGAVHVGFNVVLVVLIPTQVRCALKALEDLEQRLRVVSGASKGVVLDKVTGRALYAKRGGGATGVSLPLKVRDARLCLRAALNSTRLCPDDFKPSCLCPPTSILHRPAFF
jgi:hypothetical protein